MAKRGPGRPFKKGEGGRPKGIPNKVKLIAEEVARSILEQPEALDKLRAQARAGVLHHSIWTTLAGYAWGKPKDTLSIETMRPLVIDLVTPDDLAAARDRSSDEE